MKLQELIKLRSENAEQMEALLNEAEISERNLNEEELTRWNEFKEKDEELTKQINIRKEQDEINKRSVNTEINNKKQQTKMRKLIDLVRENKTAEGNYKFTIRSIDTTTGVYDESVAELYSNGEKPLYESMGVALLTGLTEGSVKLPKIAPIVAGKVATGTQYDNPNALGFVDLTQDERFRITETISLDMLKQDALVAGLVAEMIKGVDRKIYNEVFTVALAGATADATATAVAADDFNTLEKQVDADTVGFLMSKDAFFSAKSTQVNANSPEYLVKMNGQNAGFTFDGMPVFYNGSIAKQYIFGDLKSIVFGDWGEIEVDMERDAKKGQAYITVAKKACVKYRGVDSLVKSSIA